MLLALLVACGAPEAPIPVADPWPTAELHGAWRSVPSLETQGDLPGMSREIAYPPDLECVSGDEEG